MFNPLRVTLALLAAGVMESTSAEPPPSAPGEGVKITAHDDRLRVEIQGRLFTEYRFKDVPRPFCFPLMGPGALPMTRQWPIEAGEGEEHDHPHHRSFWFTHGAVNGHDFWLEGKGKGKTVHQEFLLVKSGKNEGVIEASNHWVAADGKLVCRDHRRLRFFDPGQAPGRVFDFEITLYPVDVDLVLGDTKEGTMAVRLAETMRVKGGLGQGHIINSAGQRDAAAWGKRAEWCDYSGPVQGQVIGLAIFDHPGNPRHPTWWHVRDYGLFAANPFGQHDFEKLTDRAAGQLVVPLGQSVSFQYRFYLHPGDFQQAGVAEKYAEYAKTPPAKKGT